jgi:quinolinate synthase
MRRIINQKKNGDRMNTGDLENKINDLKKKKNAIILAHNYQLDDVQAIADFTGDSLELSVKASKVDADVIVFCGVHFMAETAAILSPSKTVLLPVPSAGCPMADMINADQLREIKTKHPSALVVCYVNSTAEVKSESDYCCTSSNAINVVNSIPADKEIIFVPDKYLGQHVIDKTGRKMILWPGYCPTHMRITENDIRKLKEQHPDAIIMVHPECSEAVKSSADEVLSTGQMCRFASSSSNNEFIIGTEIGILYRLRKENPDKRFYPVTEFALCPNMKKITLETILWSLEDMKHIIRVEEPIRSKAKLALDRMVAITAK